MQGPHVLIIGRHRRAGAWGNGLRGAGVSAIAYEREMRAYGFRSVRNSLNAMRQTVDAGPMRPTLQRLMLRAIDRLPPFKRWMAGRMGRD